MRTQVRNEKDKKEIERLKQSDASLGTDKIYKDRMLNTTVARRGIFRGLRHTLHRLRLYLPIPGNSAEITNEYCIKFGDENCEDC